MCGPEDPFHASPAARKGPISNKRVSSQDPLLRKFGNFSRYSLNFHPNFSSQAPKFGNFQLTSSQIWKFSAHKPQIWKFSAHKPPFSEANVSSQAPHFGNPGRTPLPEKKLSAPPPGFRPELPEYTNACSSSSRHSGRCHCGIKWHMPLLSWVAQFPCVYCITLQCHNVMDYNMGSRSCPLLKYVLAFHSGIAIVLVWLNLLSKQKIDDFDYRYNCKPLEAIIENLKELSPCLPHEGIFLFCWLPSSDLTRIILRVFNLLLDP